MSQLVKKKHGLFGSDVLNFSSTKLINEIKMEKKTAKLRKYEASLKLK